MGHQYRVQCRARDGAPLWFFTRATAERDRDTYLARLEELRQRTAYVIEKSQGRPS